MHYTYRPQGTCSTQIDFSLHDGIVSDVQFTNGCDGNLQGIGRLIEGQKACDIIPRLKGIDCHARGTSCPDQLAHALALALEESEHLS